MTSAIRIFLSKLYVNNLITWEQYETLWNSTGDK